MPRQVHATPTKTKRTEGQPADETTTVPAATGDVTTEDADAWLDEIDAALEENGSTSELAALFVASFLQKGGE